MFPAIVLFDSDGNLYFPESGAHRVRKIDRKSGTITTVAGTGTPGFSGDGGPATAARLKEPSDLVFDPDGNLLIADASNNRSAAWTGRAAVIETIWGNGRGHLRERRPSGQGDARRAPDRPRRRREGNLFVVDSYGSYVLRLDAKSGLSRRIAGNGTYTFDANATNATDTGLPVPSQIRLTSAGDLVVTVTGNHAVVRLNPVTGAMDADRREPGCRGTRGTAAPRARPGSSSPRPSPSTGETMSGSSTGGAARCGGSTRRRASSRRVSGATRVDRRGDTQTAGFSGDGGPAGKAQLWHPSGLGFDKDGNLYILDAHNSRIRKVENAAP